MNAPFTLPAQVRVRSAKMDKLTLVCNQCTWTYAVGNRPELVHLAVVAKRHLATHEIKEK